MKKKIMLSSILTIMAFSGCGSDDGGAVDTGSGMVVVPPNSEEADTAVSTTNVAPLVDAGVDKTVTVNSTVILNGSATDSDGTVVSYRWNKGEEVLGTKATLSYIPTEVGTDTLTLTVMDDDGDSGSDSVNIIVTAEQGATDEEEEDIDSDFGGKK